MATSIPVYSTLPDTGYLRLPQVLRFIPIGRSTWWAGVKSGRFPPAIKLSKKTTVWKAEDIRVLIAEFTQTDVDEGEVE